MSIVEKIKAGLGKVAEETAEAAEIARIKVEITNLKKKMDEEAEKVGYIIYEKFKKGAPPDPDVIEILKNMESIEKQIAEKENRIRKLKEEAPPPS